MGRLTLILSVGERGVRLNFESYVTHFPTPLPFQEIVISSKNRGEGSRDGAVVEYLPPMQASHQYGPGSIPGLSAVCGLSLLLVLVLSPRGFSPGTPVSPSPQKPTFLNFNSIWNPRATGSVVRLPSVTLVNQS